VCLIITESFNVIVNDTSAESCAIQTVVLDEEETCFILDSPERYLIHCHLRVLLY